MIFDETFIHTAENGSDAARLILFCDIERPFAPRPVAWLNRAFRNTVIRASQTENVAGEKVGLVNRIFSYVYHVRLFGKRVKERSRFAYYAAQVAADRRRAGRDLFHLSGLARVERT